MQLISCSRSQIATWRLQVCAPFTLSVFARIKIPRRRRRVFSHTWHAQITQSVLHCWRPTHRVSWVLMDCFFVCMYATVWVGVYSLYFLPYSRCTRIIVHYTYISRVPFNLSYGMDKKKKKNRWNYPNNRNVYIIHLYNMVSVDD